MERVIRAFWQLSVLIVFFGLMFSFASLPEQVLYSEIVNAISRDMYFYSALSIIAFTNFILYAFARKFSHQKPTTTLNIAVPAWLNSLNFSLNIFYFVGLMFVMMYNSNEKWNYDLLGYGIYFSIGLIAISIISLPVFLKTSSTN